MHTFYLYNALTASQIQQSTRLGQSRAILNNLNGRHQDIQKLERQVTDMAQMFQDLNRLVVAQEEQVANINQRAEETAEHVRKGAGETVIAVDSARAARRKKWICFWIVGKCRMSERVVVHGTDSLFSGNHPYRCSYHWHRCWHHS